MNFERMFTPPYCPYTENVVVELCNKLWKDNREQRIDKAEYYIPAELQLNNWIEKQLEDMVVELKKKEAYMRSHYLLC